MEIIRSLYPSITVKRNPPANIIPEHEKYFGGPSYSFITPPSNLLRYRNVTVTHDGIIIKNLVPQKDLIVNYYNDFINYRHRYLAHVFLKHKKVTLPDDKKYMLVFDNYSGPKGLAHWYSDSLTRLIEIKDMMQDYVALVPYYYKKNEFINDSLQLLGIKNVIAIEQNTRVKVIDLYVPSHIAPSGNFNPENVNKLRQFMWENNSEKLKFSLGERIYISRSRAEFRYVINEKEVIELLNKYDFKVVYMEDYTLAQKISMVYNAKYMVSIIGAAFSFIHFMQPGSTIMEFRKRNDGENCIYWALSDALGLNYYYQYGDAIVHRMSGYMFDLKMDVEELKKNIELMLSRH